MNTVLVVEDDKNQRLLYEEELTEEGYRVVTAPDGRQALQSLREQAPDIIVLDINMPVMDGLDTLSQMMEINSAVPVIINTAYISYKESFTSWSADAYVVKSSDLSELKNTIRDFAGSPKKQFAILVKLPAQPCEYSQQPNKEKSGF